MHLEVLRRCMCMYVCVCVFSVLRLMDMVAFFLFRLCMILHACVFRFVVFLLPRAVYSQAIAQTRRVLNRSNTRALLPVRLAAPVHAPGAPLSATRNCNHAIVVVIVVVIVLALDSRFMLS